MHALLLIGTNKKEIEKRIEAEAEEKKATVIFFPVQKISEAKEISSFVKLSRKDPVLLVCESVDTAGIESLNSLLKILEEPGENIFFALTAKNANQVLPTIISRCTVVNVGAKKLSEKTLGKLEKFLKNSASKKLLLIDKVNSREQAMSLINNVMFFAHKNLKVNLRKNYEILKVSQIAQNRLNSNANVKLQLINYCISLP